MRFVRPRRREVTLRVSGFVTGRPIRWTNNQGVDSSQESHMHQRSKVGPLHGTCEQAPVSPTPIDECMILYDSRCWSNLIDDHRQDGLRPVEVGLGYTPYQ